ncbi:hypothetical protein ACI65C_007029 [Semiaphis heraclei]
MGSKEKQDTYLCALITVNKIVRRRPKTGDGPTRSCSCKFKIRINIREVNVCKKAFCSLLGIGKSRVDSPVDLRGKHMNRPKKIPEYLIFKIHSHIASFPKRSSHYSRSDNSNTQYLSSDLTISKMYKLFLQLHNKDTYDKLENGDLTCKPIAKADEFVETLTFDFEQNFPLPHIPSGDVYY